MAHSTGRVYLIKSFLQLLLHTITFGIQTVVTNSIVLQKTIQEKRLLPIPKEYLYTLYRIMTPTAILRGEAWWEVTQNGLLVQQRFERWKKTEAERYDGC
jgi:hypothetical protein